MLKVSNPLLDPTTKPNQDQDPQQQPDVTLLGEGQKSVRRPKNQMLTDRTENRYGWQKLYEKSKNPGPKLQKSTVDHVHTPPL